MLNTEERRVRLEELLARVKRNRGYLEEKRASETAEEEEPEYQELPLPFEPSPKEIDSVNATTAQILGAQQTESNRGDFTPTETPAKIPEEKPEALASMEELSVEEPFLDESEEITRTEPALEQEDETAAAHEDEEVYVPDVEDEITEEAVEQTISAPELSVKRFETEPAASGDVAVQKGERQREWTLAAVLDRAWKLGE